MDGTIHLMSISIFGLPLTTFTLRWLIAKDKLLLFNCCQNEPLQLLHCADLAKPSLPDPLFRYRANADLSIVELRHSVQSLPLRRLHQNPGSSPLVMMEFQFGSEENQNHDNLR